MTTTPRLQVMLNREKVAELRRIGRALVNNQRASVNDCLSALIGEYKRLKKIEDGLTVKFSKGHAEIISQPNIGSEAPL